MKLKNYYIFDTFIYIISIIVLGIILPKIIFKNPSVWTYLLFSSITLILFRIRSYYKINNSVQKIFNNFISAIEKTDNIDLNSDEFKDFGSGLTSLEYDAELFVKSYINSVQNNNIIMKKLEHNNNLLNNLININNEMHKYNSVEEFYDYILNMAVDSIPNATHGSLMKLAKNNFLEFVSLVGYSDVIKETKIHLFKSFLWNETNGLFDRAVIVNNIFQYNKESFSEKQKKVYDEEIYFKVVTSISTPILIDGKMFGMINVDSSQEDAFAQKDIELMMFFAKRISIAINNRILMEDTIYLSRYDSLTGILNRGYFEEIVSVHIKKALRYNESFTLIVFDLDNLKTVNDNFGHKMGDTFLTDFTKIVKNNIRDSDIFARYGGDEFILLMFESNRELILNKLNSIAKYAIEYSIKKQRVYKLEFSYGFGIFPEDSDNFDHLVTIADEKMYKRKRNKNKKEPLCPQ